MNITKKRRLINGRRLLAIFLVALFVAYSGLALTKALPVAKVEASDIAPKVSTVGELAWPATGQAAIGTLSDGFLVSKSTEERRPIASITKVVTALAVLDKLPLQNGQSGPTFTIEQVDIDIYRAYVAKYGSVMPVNFGQKISELDALYGMMLPSGNNIADGLANWVFGGMEEYLIYANDMLERYELDNTVVADASGFSPGSQSTPSDLIKLGQLALGHPVLSQIVSTRTHNVPGSGPLNNTNFLLSTDENVVGIKTGNTDEAGSCLLFAYRFGQNNEEVFIGVLMNQPRYYGMFSSAQALKESAMPYFKTMEVLPAGAVVGSVATSWGKSSDIVTVEPLKVFGWAGHNYEPQVVLDEVEAPIIQGQVLGRAYVEGNDETKVVAKDAVGGPGIFWRMSNFF